MNLTPVEGVSFGGGLLSWKTIADGSPGTAKEGELIFVLKSADLRKTRFAFIICCLAEEEDGSSPYRPSFLATHTLPGAIPGRLILGSLPEHLSMVPGVNSVDVIVSVESGTKLALAFWETVLQPLLSLCREVLRATPTPTGHADAPIDAREPHVVVTQSAHSVRQYARALDTPDKGGDDSAGVDPRWSRTILLLSGDGGVVDLLNGRDESVGMASTTGDPPHTIALLPLGTGNALFHSLHKPFFAAAATDVSPLVLALRTLLLGSAAKKLPTFKASFSPGARIVSFASAAEDGCTQEKNEVPVDHLQGAIVASYGLHASIVYESDTPEYRVHGAKRFGMVAQDLLRESHPYRAHVDIRRPQVAGNDEPTEANYAAQQQQLERLPRESHGYVLATLVSNLEQTFCISPSSKPLDGQLRLVHFAPVGGERTMAAMAAAYDGGKHVGMKWDEDGEEVGYEQIDEVRVTVLEEDERWRKVCVDGTIVEIPRGGYMSVTKTVDSERAFQVLVDPCIVGM